MPIISETYSAIYTAKIKAVYKKLITFTNNNAIGASLKQ
jgi:hypothetical protein